MWKPWLLDYFIKWVNITELSCTYFFHLRRATVPETVGRLDFSRELVSSESRLPRMYIEKAVRIPHSVPSVCFISMPKLISRTVPNLFRKCFCDACLARKDKLTLFLFQIVKTFTRVVNNISPSYFVEKMYGLISTTCVKFSCSLVPHWAFSFVITVISYSHCAIKNSYKK